MTTNFNDFKKLYDRIPKDRKEFVRFIPLRPQKKNPLSGSWKPKNLNYHEVKNFMKNGYNIGVVALPKGICVIDLDTDIDKNLINYNIANEFYCEDTFTVETRSGGLHFYFLNNGICNTQDFIVDDRNIGELRANWSYVVSAGSYVDIDRYAGGYKVIRDLPIKPLPDSVFNKYFKKGDTETRKDEKISGKTGKLISDRIQKHMEEIGLKVL